ncbi:hypothetical protein [Ruminococcus sp.]|uniref:ABC transporter substrate-binding protein n=1 Tax=Ruminococcus sp. TaxID=41978 RepID=UPI002CACEB20|nr:hypothetical protein [Ruminococcus sp.]HNZ99893.1 extracellular solute-binding protein [Ruminococcus sp.]HOH88084.1 extracellular solute-binding protein [Ruminococcus sp.]
MKNSILRTLAFSAAVCVSMTSCAEKKKTSSDNSTSIASAISDIPAMASELLEGSYKLVNYKTIDEFDYIDRIFPLNEGGYIVSSFNGSSETDFMFKINSDFSEINEFSLSAPDEVEAADEFYSDLSVTPGGEISVLYTLLDHHGIELPEEYDENFDYDSFYANTTESKLLCFYKSDGSLISSHEFDDSEFSSNDDMIYMTGYINIGGGRILAAYYDGTVILTDGSTTEKFPVIEEGAEKDYINLVYTGDGSVAVSYSYYYNGDYNSRKQTIKYIDIENKTYGDTIYSSDASEINDIDMAIPGYDDYVLIGSNYTDLIGIKADGTTETILNWSDADTQPLSVLYAGNDEFYCWDYMSNDSLQIMKLVPRDPAEAANTQVITLGTMYDSHSLDVNKFNRSQDKYRIKVVNYSERYAAEHGELDPEADKDDWENRDAEMLKYMQMDIISGNAPDMIISYDINSVRLLGEKGVLTDLYTFMENDPDINRDTVLPNLLSALESSDGKLYCLSPNFELRTLAVKRKFFDRENWTVDDMIELFDHSNAEHLYDGDTKAEMLRTFIEGQSELIDVEKGTCNFDTPDFINILKFCDRFVLEEEMPDKSTETEDFMEYYTDKANWIADEKALLTPVYPYGDSGLCYIKSDTFGGDDYTMVGYPSSNGKGGKLSVLTQFSICEKSKVKEGAWEFIKSLMDPEENFSFPALKKNLPDMIDASSKVYSYKENGEKVEIPSSGSKVGRTIYPVSKAERDDFERYLLSCDTLSGEMDYEVRSIVMEEADAFFHGEKSAEDAAKMIQNRASILVSERS